MFGTEVVVIPPHPTYAVKWLCSVRPWIHTPLSKTAHSNGALKKDQQHHAVQAITVVTLKAWNIAGGIQLSVNKYSI